MNGTKVAGRCDSAAHSEKTSAHAAIGPVVRPLRWTSHVQRIAAQGIGAHAHAIAERLLETGEEPPDSGALAIGIAEAAHELREWVQRGPGRLLRSMDCAPAAAGPSLERVTLAQQAEKCDASDCCSLA